MSLSGLDAISSKQKISPISLLGEKGNLNFLSHCPSELGFLYLLDNSTRKFLTNRIAAFFKFGPIKLIYSEKMPSRVKKQPVE
jgi:hypothetical protein